MDCLVLQMMMQSFKLSFNAEWPQVRVAKEQAGLLTGRTVVTAGDLNPEPFLCWESPLNTLKSRPWLVDVLCVAAPVPVAKQISLR